MVSPSVFVESELVDSASEENEHEDEIQRDNKFFSAIQNKPQICPQNLFKTPYNPIDVKLTIEEIEKARFGFLQFMNEREIARDKLVKSVMLGRQNFSTPPPDTSPKPVCSDPVPVVSPKMMHDDNSAIIRSAITGTCLPGETFKFQRDEIFHIMKQVTSRYIILFSETNRFAGIYAVLDDGVAHRVYSIPDPFTSCPHQIVPAIVQRRFRYTCASGFVEIGSRYNARGFWDSIDAVNLKNSRNEKFN